MSLLAGLRGFFVRRHACESFEFLFGSIKSDKPHARFGSTFIDKLLAFGFISDLFGGEHRQCVQPNETRNRRCWSFSSWPDHSDAISIGNMPPEMPVPFFLALSSRREPAEAAGHSSFHFCNHSAFHILCTFGVLHRFEHKPEVIVRSEAKIIAVAPFLRSLAFGFGQWLRFFGHRFGDKPAHRIVSSCLRIISHASSLSAHQRTAFRSVSRLSAIPASEPSTPPMIRVHSRSVKSVRTPWGVNGSATEGKHASARARRQGSPVLDVPEKRQNRIEDYLCACA